jgi:hypothetical protein
MSSVRATRRSRPTNPQAREASAAVRRAVWLRDLGRCKFIGTDGHRCNERRFVGFHHVDPYALGGEATVDKIELRCRRHNDYEGRLYFGKRRRDGGGIVREAAAPRGVNANSFQNEFATGPSHEWTDAAAPTAPGPTIRARGSSWRGASAKPVAHSFHKKSRT